MSLCSFDLNATSQLRLWYNFLTSSLMQLHKFDIYVTLKLRLWCSHLVSLHIRERERKTQYFNTSFCFGLPLPFGLLLLKIKLPLLFFHMSWMCASNEVKGIIYIGLLGVWIVFKRLTWYLVGQLDRGGFFDTILTQINSFYSLQDSQWDIIYIAMPLLTYWLYDKPKST